MDILHLNTKEISGGAARAANRLNVGLVRLNINSKMLVAQKESADSRTLEFKPRSPKPLNLPQRLKRYLKRHTDFLKKLVGQASNLSNPLQFEYYSATRPAGYELFSDGSSSHKDELIEQIPLSDIYHLHWIVRFIDYQTFFSNAAKFYPIVWTLHDMNAFTGGCHYDHGCGKYKTGCGKCPQLGSSLQNDLSSFVWHNKQESFKNLDPKYLHIVTPSQWLGEQCKKSPLIKKFPLMVIPNGLDTDDLSPRDRVFSREVLGIPQDADTLLFVAESVDNRRKGFRLLIDALSGISATSKLYLLIIGKLKTNTQIHFPNTQFGSINNDRLLSLIYSAADLYVIPSIQDNLPNTVIESMSCGTPIIGFKVGGISEMVQNGINGYLAPLKDVNVLREKITFAFRNKNELEKMSKNCRLIAENNYSIRIQAERYLELYKILLTIKK